MTRKEEIYNFYLANHSTMIEREMAKHFGVSTEYFTKITSEKLRANINRAKRIREANG